MKTPPDLVFGLWTQALMLFLAVGCAAALIVGVWMLFKPETLLQANRFLSRWFSVRQATRPLMVPRRIERFVYRQHRPIGLLVLAGAAYVLYALFTRYDRQTIIAGLFGAVPYPQAAWLVPGLAVALGVGALFALAIGGFLLIRPSLLKSFEAWANQWVTARRATKFLDVMRHSPDQFVTRHPRLVAVLIIAGSLYGLVGLMALMR